MQLLHCKQYNRGNSHQPPLVMLHGFLGSSDDWQDFALSLPKNIGCYAIDLPGHGKSINIELSADDAFAQCSQLIAATLEKQGLSQYILLGYSLGGRIALYHACQYPDKIKGLILESCHFGLSDAKQKQQRILSDNTWADRFSTDNLTDVLLHWYQQDVFTSLTESQKQNLIIMRSQLNGAAIGKMLLATSLGKQTCLAVKFATLNIPSYYFFGEKDFKYQAIANKFKQLCSHLTTLKVTQSGHNIHFEQPKIFTNKIVEIYAQLLANKN